MHKNRNLYSCYLQSKQNNDDKVAVYVGDKSYSYVDLVNSSARYANTLTGLGIKPGVGSVSISISQSTTCFYTWLACARGWSTSR